MKHRWWLPSLSAIVLAVLCVATVGPSAVAQPAADELDRPYEGSVVLRIDFEGLDRVPLALARNQLRTATGRPLDWTIVREDVRRLERLGEFSDLSAEIEPLEGGGVAVVFVVDEAPVVTDIVVVGNNEISDSEIAEVVSENIALVTGVPVDPFRIQQAVRAIEDLYRRSGYFQVDVTIDQSELEDTGVIIFRVREGERVRITAIRFEGQRSFSSRRIQANINTRKSGIFERGPIDEQIIERDIAAIRQFYVNNGFLDARVSHRLTFSPNGREAILTFLIEEGPVFTVREVLAFASGADPSEAGGGLTVMTADQIRALSKIKPGAVIEGPVLRDSVSAVADALKQMGYADANARGELLRIRGERRVDVLILVSEGDALATTNRFRAGLTTIIGNNLTQDRVIRRRLALDPDRWLNAALIDESEASLRNSRLFDPQGTSITVLEEDPEHPGYRDVVVEVQETNTGSLTFGASVDSDAGLVGNITLNQRNFDILDTPDSFGELIRGRAFRGAGQTFNLLIAPGTELSQYAVSLTEPALFDSVYSLSGNVFFRTRDFDLFDEERLGGAVAVGRNFGVRWQGNVAISGENIDIEDETANPLRDTAEVEGNNVLTEVAFELTRNTLDDFFQPGSGTRSEFRIVQAGALGGDFTYTRLEAEHVVFATLIEDELGRKTTLRLNGRIGIIPQDDEVPIFERFYLGGRSFRGFEFRGIGPTGVRLNGATTDEKVGGSFLFFLGAQVQRPVVSDLIDVVAFIDSGTINEEASLEDYRVSVGVGLRLFLPQFGRAPLAFDFAVPLTDFESDDEQLFSFSVELPF